MRTFGGDNYDADAFGGGGEPQSAVPLPDAVGEMAAGAELADMLDGVPVERVSGHDTVTYMTAAYRLATHYQGLFLKALLETGLRVPAPDDRVVRTDQPGEFAAEEARAALVWSRSRAEGTFGRAYEMFAQNAAIGEALLDATIDEPRAKAFCSWTSGLADEHAERIIDELLPRAPKLTVSELIDRIKRMAIALDPDWAERRYRDSVRERRIELRQTPDGTADLAGRDLPADRAKTGSDRIHRLAQACKRAGDKRRIDTIRADLYLGMLDGQFQHMTDQHIVDHVLAHPVADDPTDNDPDNHGRDGGHGFGDSGPSDGDPSGPGGPGGSGGPDNRDPGEPGDSGSTGNRDPGEPADSGPSGAKPSGAKPSGAKPSGAKPSGAKPSGAKPSGAKPRCAKSGDGGNPDGTGGPDNRNSGDPGDDHPGDDPYGYGGAESSDAKSNEDGPGDEPGPAWNVAELRVELSTLLGMDEHPAELPGLGYIPAMVARPLAERMGAAEWRFVICTPDGTPICSGITTHRPTKRSCVPRDPKRGGILELQLSSSKLFELATAISGGRHADWQHVIGDIADRYRSGILDHKAGDINGPAGEAGTPGDDEGDARRRRARAGLRRWVEVRDRYCLHPACRMPASQTDQDHRTDYAAGGLTIEQNLDSECRHDHVLQHDGHWRVHRPPGSDPLTGPIIWTSPLGHQYESRPPPVMHPYPEPGSHYPGEAGMPTWFTELLENIKASQQASVEKAEPETTEPARPTVIGHPVDPPF